MVSEGNLLHGESFGSEQKRSTVREMIIHTESGNRDEIGDRFNSDEARLRKELT